MDVNTLVAALTLGLLLSLSTGIRAFLAPFALSVATAAGWVDLGVPWLGTPLALVTFGSAIVFEVAADKIPAVDHCMDLLHLLVKPVAGTLVAYSMMEGADPVVAAVGSLATGGMVAGCTHVAKATLRVGSTTTTFGAGNPVISIIEDVVAVCLAALAVWGVSA